ncbi:sulfatase-like hydrolase/transferase [Roseiconus nitratireducens]|uniref:Sulfatase-like hydrolase/transferase n=1 Tax=Roseiconus nitratireducens TaxID=2605748 RepID=A0A5M6CVQ1_9BACT|nr:sulfatase-like hydrolase/transferase [Roseiconus nitratireducens]KAA5539016.1 sulfatase-like hydrolase/transferase [Roseiconus nitratireducens]
MKSIFFVLALVACATSVGAAEPPRPNILYLYVDDMGWGSIGPNGQAQRQAAGQPYVRTPNLNRLAAEGLNFTRGYGCHVCSPARSSQQSGFHQGHTFADRNDPDNAKKAMRADDVLIGDALSAAGYVTGYWGKWGYGGSKDRVGPVIQNVQTLPTSHGYQHVLAELHHVRAHTFFQPTLWKAPASLGSTGGVELVPNSMTRYQGDGDYPDTPAMQNHGEYPETAYCDDSYAFAALDFIRSQGTQYNETGRPFFGLLAVQIPHAPFGQISTLPKWDQAYDDDPWFDSLDDQTRQWAAMVTRIDAHFGNLFDALQDPNNDGDPSDSIANNTLIVFQSDNGGPRGRNNAQLDANGGLRGTKGMIQEGGIRVPLVMRWPAMIREDSRLQAGTNCQRVVDVTDLLPTFCELAGAEIPLGIDGMSIAPFLQGSDQQREREFIIHEAGNGQSIIRDRYKLIRVDGRRGGPPNLTLYDLREDPSESNDIAGDHPTMVEALHELLLGERVTEPRGFANTYHQWTGPDGASAADAANWSEYRYANAGVTYQVDDGAPQLSWTARMENSGPVSSVAKADSDLQFLALEIRGDQHGGGAQFLVLQPGINLTGRNEIRIGKQGVLSIDGGTVSTLRWIENLPGGTLRGHGTIQGTVFNHGRVQIDGGDPSPLHVHGDYRQTDEAELTITLPPDEQALLNVDGRAALAGTLTVRVGPGFRPAPDETWTIVKADRVTGRFDNSRDRVVSTDGHRFRIQYSESEVTLKVD